MKTRDTDTVLFKLRVSAPAPSSSSKAAPFTNAMSCPTSSRRQEQRTIVFNGISANSWLLPIGISHRDSLSARTALGKDDAQPKLKISQSYCRPASGRLEPELQGTKTMDKDSDSDEQDDKRSGRECGSPSECEGTATDQGVTSSGPCAETTRTCALTPDEFDSMWKRVSQRPQSTGRVFIVRRRNLPVGLGRHEYLQGQHLRSKFEEEPGESAEKAISIKPPPRPYTAPGRRQARMAEDKASCQRPFSHTGVRGRWLPDHRIPSHPTPLNSSIDLVVTSIHRSKTVDSTTTATTEEPPGEINADEDTAKERDPPRPKTTSASAGRSRQPSDPMDTIEGIKRSYLQRARSAPPNMRSVDVSSTSSCRGPSLYWRARSAYHKKLLTYGPDEGPDPNEPTQNVRGSLWRPLLVGEDGGVMQHSAGCPYKCKGCFKACLVSEDYLQKARAQKLLREKEEARKARGTGTHVKPVTHKYRMKIQDPNSVVSIALARSQPLYKLVYHGSSEDHVNPSKDCESVAKDAEKNGEVVNERDGVKQVGDDVISTTDNDTKKNAEAEEATA